MQKYSRHFGVPSSGGLRNSLDDTVSFLKRLRAITTLASIALVISGTPFTGRVGAAISPPGGPFVSPRTPGALAVSPTGVLYVVDASRDQILRRVDGGRFQVVAGDGHRGFTGDGHAAIDAKISVNQDSALVVTSDGTVVFVDQGGRRVREILPSGDIETIAGGGREPLGNTTLSAKVVSLAGADIVNALATGRGGQLYLGVDGVYRLSGGFLHWIVGSDSSALNRGFKGFGVRPVVQKDFDPAYTLAVDGKGDLLVGGGGTWSLYERTVAGALRFVQEDRAQGGYYAAMATAPDGNVVLAGGVHGLAWFHPSGAITDGPASVLSGLLASPSHFTPGEGIAVAPNGALYLDADAGNGFTNVSAIVRVTAAGRAKVLWQS